MLLQFSFKNFKSFRDDTVLDMTSARVSELPEHLSLIGEEKILPAAAIYGPNASGKSNVVEAFRFMCTYVLDSFAYGGANTKGSIQKPRRTPFLFDKNSRNEVSSFEVYFISGEEDGYKTYNYGFTLDDDGIKEEWLNSKAKTSGSYRRIFYRVQDETDFSSLPKKIRDNLKVSLEKDTLVVSLGSRLKISKLKMVADWFSKIEFANYGDPFENAWRSTTFPEFLEKSAEARQKVVSYFASFDPSIIGLNVRKIQSDDNVDHGYDIYTVHRIAGTDEVTTIPLRDESDGTLKMFSLYPLLDHVTENGGILCVDELNSRLHPLLVRNFLLSFLNPEINTNHAQIIFTTHDTWQLSNHLLRRDEIWFTKKDSSQVTSLYSLAEFEDESGTKIRKDESYEKNYMLGKYGAIPELKPFNMTGGENAEK